MRWSSDLKCDHDSILFSITAPGDYSSVAMTLTFSPGVSELLVPVQTTEDQLAEPVENLIGRLSAVFGSGQRVILGVDQATAAIEDNDGERK